MLYSCPYRGPYPISPYLETVFYQCSTHFVIDKVLKRCKEPDERSERKEKIAQLIIELISLLRRVVCGDFRGRGSWDLLRWHTFAGRVAGC